MRKLDQIKIAIALDQELPLDSEMIEGDFVLEKIDDKFGGNHPNGINPGIVFNPKKHQEIQVGQAPYFFDGDRWLRTSTVESVQKNENEIVFKTENSTYRLCTL